jgi:hypothetical protein
MNGSIRFPGFLPNVKASKYRYFTGCLD